MNPPRARILKWQPSALRTRIGYVDLRFDSILLTIRAVEVHTFTSHSGEHRLWLSYPGRPYKRDGVERVFTVIYFSRAAHHEIADAVFAQLKTLAPEVFADVEARAA